MSNMVMQFGLVGFTLAGYLMTSMKLPEYGVILGLISQFFRLYSSYRAWKEAKQSGVLITTLFMIVVMTYGVINYRFL